MVCLTWVAKNQIFECLELLFLFLLGHFPVFSAEETLIVTFFLRNSYWAKFLKLWHIRQEHFLARERPSWLAVHTSSILYWSWVFEDVRWLTTVHFQRRVKLMSFWVKLRYDIGAGDASFLKVNIREVLVEHSLEQTIFQAEWSHITLFIWLSSIQGRCCKL